MLSQISLDSSFFVVVFVCSVKAQFLGFGGFLSLDKIEDIDRTAAGATDGWVYVLGK